MNAPTKLPSCRTRRGILRATFAASRLLVVLLGLGFTLAARGEETNQSFMLPKSPAAAAYVLGRLSNPQLIAAPRSEFVYVALLQRRGLERKYRLEAMAGLAKLRGTDPVTELLAGLVLLDKKGETSDPVIRDLVPLVLEAKPEALTAHRSALENLAQESQLAITRQLGYAAIISADNSPDQAWEAAAVNPIRLSDLILSLPLIADATIRAPLYPRLEPLLRQADLADVRRAAITAIPAISGHDVETFNTLASMFIAGTEREAVVASLERIPRQSWPKDQAEPLIESLVPYLKTFPVENRTDPAAVLTFQFAGDLTALLPADQAATVTKTLRALGVSVFVVRTVREQMLYDQKLIVVEAGKPVTLILINEDAMPHNLVIVAPGTVEEIGSAAEKLPPEPDAQGRLYLPHSPKLLYGTKLVGPGQQAKLSFTAPEEPGDYAYVCTFPGHWRRMVGTLAVVKDVDAYLAAHGPAAPPKMTEWKIADLAGDISKLDANRNLPHGRELFTKLACANCHKVGPMGVSYGPELTDIFPQYRNNAADVLRQILEPSLIISNRYRAFDFELNNGDELAGMVVKEEDETMTVQTGPSQSLFQTLKKSDIKKQVPRTTSIMPTGLLNTLSVDDILDLLEFLRAGGNITAHEHPH